MIADDTPNEAGLIPTLENEILLLADHEAWLDAQIRELEFTNKQDTASSLNDTHSPEESRRGIEQRIDILKQELLTAASLESVRAKVVDRLLADAIQERDAVVSEYLLIHRDLQKARQELSTTQIQVLDCQYDNRKLVQLLSSETEAAKEATASRNPEDDQRAARRIEEGLKDVNIKDDIVSNVLQGLMLESGVDWVNDPHYLSVMLRLKRAE
ncbi:hypothetical protein BGX34_009819 [Mortierella sp. NVP85]|nr:hypothetical protein BGX34_009819 [Mortierella sp. NVP85]